jgi:hypothetical protein
MPLDTRLPLLAGQFKPLTYQAPSQANMLAEVAQAASAMQGLQRNAMAMRQEREKEQRVGSLSQMLSQLAASGETPASLRQMGQALVSSQMPEFMTKGMTLIQRAGELEQALRQQERDEASMARILGEETSSGVSVPAAPAGGVAPAASVAPSAAPAVAQNAMAPSAPAANAMLPELRQSDMIQGGAAGTATTSAVGRGVGAPMLTQFMPPMPPRTEYDEATARIDAMRRSISLQITRAQDPGLTEQERLQAREIATLQSTELQKAQQTIGNYLANMGEADLPGGLIEPAQVPVRLQMPPELAPAAAPQPEPAPVVTPRASAAAGTQVAGPMVAGAAPDANQTEINRLEARRERVRTGDLSAARKKDEIAEIDRKLGILREQSKPTELLRNYQAAVAQGYRGTIEDFRKSGATSVQVSTGPQEKAFESALGKGQADKVLADKAVADDAVSIIETARRGRELLSGPIITGFGAEFLTAAGSALNQAGFSFAADSVANTQAFAANMAQNVAKIIKQFGAGTGLSNADREYAEKMAGGKVSLDKAALLKILEINERAAKNVINRHTKHVEGIKTTIPVRVELPSEIAAPSGTAAPAGRPAGVGADWTLKQDAKGNRAWVSPDGKRFVEVK